MAVSASNERMIAGLAAASISLDPAHLSVLDDAGLKEIEDRVRAEIERSVKFADSSPEPAPEELYTNIYATPIKGAGQ